METLTHQLSNIVNQLILLAIILVALFRLTDGLREQLFERVCLVVIMGGAFFLLASNAHAGHIRFGNDVVHSSTVVSAYFLWYFKIQSAERCSLR